MPTRRIAVAALGWIFVAGCGTLHHSGGAEVSAEVMDVLRADGRADVMVALKLPPGFEAEPGSERLRAEIARLQDDVLASMDDGDFRVRQRFKAIPALAGTVLTERGLRRLSSHPGVVRVDMDAGGGGGTDPEPPPPGGEG
jgi:hypothetical protein